MTYYPAFLDLNGKKVLIVGGGAVAQRKVETLLEYGASVFVAAKTLSPGLKGYEEEGRIRFLGEEFREEQMEGAILVIAATDDRDLNRQVSLSARKKGILVNAVDQPSDCSFIVPSILRRGELVIAVSTSGKSPALAKRLREELEKRFGTEYEPYLDMLGEIRKEILSRPLSAGQREEIFRDLIRSDLLDAIRRGDRNRAASILEGILGAVDKADFVQKLLRMI
jgi:precorrin-2 dehydrogenase/sirohydrochlorin ferrochelatase